MNFQSSELKEFKGFKGLLIDVRSPDEYYKGHMPNSINIPIFNNEERVYIGKKYKNAGRRKAILEGLNIVYDKLDMLIEKLISAEKKYFSKNNNINSEKLIKVYCARGGMRSLSINWLLKRIRYNSITLKGGYKSYRNWVLESFKTNRNITIIGGKTGTGKTKLLNILKNKNYQVIDLESLANHRGSSFGWLGMKKQPSSEHFENLLAENLDRFSKERRILVESESANIGKCRIPFEFYKQMKNSPRLEIIKNKQSRLNELIGTYSVFNKDDLKNSILKIAKRLGPQRTKKAIVSLEKEDWEGVCDSVLEYYDKCYDYELENSENVYEINLINKNDTNAIEELIKNELID